MDGGSDPRWSAEPIGLMKAKRPVNALAEDKGIFRVWSRQSISYKQGLPFREATPRKESPELISRLDDYASRCEPMGMPSIMGTPHPFEFVDRGSTIQLLGLSNNARIDRVIHMSGQPTPVNQPLSRMGHSSGRWGKTPIRSLW